MRRFLGIALWLIACGVYLAPAVAFWQSRDSGYNVSVGGGGGAAPTWTATDHQTQNTSSTTVTFASVAIGTASSDRIVVVAVNTNINIVTSLTIGGVSATKAVEESSGISGLQIWYANVTSGTTASIVLTSGGAMSNESINVGKLTGVTALPSSTNTSVPSSANPRTISVTVPSTGFGIVAIYGTSATPTWTNATLDFNTVDGNANFLSSANDSVAGTNTVSVSNGNVDNSHMVSSSWGP